MSGSKISNRFMQAAIEAYKHFDPKAFHSCPYEGRYELLNIRPDKKLLSFYPPGVFRVYSKIADDVAKAVVIVSYLIEIS